MSDSPLIVKSKAFSLEVIQVCKELRVAKCESALINQFLRSGTSIGANIREAFYAHGKADFIDQYIPPPQPEKCSRFQRLLFFWNDVFRKRNVMCPSGVMFATQVMCASRVRMRNTSHHFAPKAQYITVR